MQLKFDPLAYEYPSRRNVVYGKKGMVATGNPYAAQAGLAVLKQGGNAVDAAVAAAAALTVVEPTANGIGGDAFALVWTGGRLHGLNASGPAPMAISLQAMQDKGYEKMPAMGVDTVDVPGAPAAWAALSKRFGRLPLTQTLAPAIEYAADGYVLQPGVGSIWQLGYNKFTKAAQDDPAYAGWVSTFAPDGKCRKTGDFITLPDHARTLREIAQTGADSFYRGALADRIDRYFREIGGWLRKEDLAAFQPEWVDPISTQYKGYDVWEIPPNGHGITVLMALNILKGMALGGRDSFESTHYQIEAMKLAFADTQKYVADPRSMQVRVDELLDETYAASRRACISETALLPEAGTPKKGGTVYLCTADGAGNMVSYIQSNYMGFGSGIVVPGTGIAMHNRGSNFSLDPASDNCIAGGKRPYHTIIPGFLTRDGQAVGPFGIMGGFMQPQAHLQVMIDTIEYGMNPQEALDRPRWMWTGGRTIEVEQNFPNRLAKELQRAGHDIVVKADPVNFGRGEIIWRDAGGVLCGACEPRTDGTVATW